MKILLKNARVVDHKNKLDGKMDILLENDKISKISEKIEESVDREIDCTNYIIIPGMIDMHCHLREPGFEYKETIETGSKSAVAGGFTTICPMPNTKPVPDNVETLKMIIEKAKAVNLCNVLPFSSITKGEKGEELVDFKAMKEAGAIAFSDDGIPVVNSKVMREGMIKANEVGSFTSAHCEEKSVAKGAINAGKIAEKLGVEGVLPEAEEIMAARDAIIAETNDIPHYFSLTVDEVLRKGTNAKMNPPLREEKDRLAIIEGLKEGTIDCIITDHAPHSEEEKAKSLADSPNGIIGFETALSCEIMNLIDTGALNYDDLVRVTSYNPAKLLGLNTKGAIEVGFDADLTIFDPNKEYVYTKDMIVSKAKNSPFIDEKMKGKVVYTIVGGRVVYEEK